MSSWPRIAIASLAGLAACAAPAPRRIEVPAPPAPSAIAPPRQVPPSAIPIRVRVDLAPLIALMKAMAPAPLARSSEVLALVDRPLLKVQARVDYEARLADVRVNVSGSTLTLTAVIDLALALEPTVRGLGGRVRIGAGRTSCGHGEPMPRVEVAVVGRLRTVPGPALVFERVSWRHRWVRPCRLTAFNISIDRIARLPMIRDRVNAAVEQALARAPDSIDLAARAHVWWKRFDRAHRIAPGAWLVPHPQRMELSPVLGNGTALEAILTVHARPRIVLGAEPSVASAPMPPVTLGRTSPRAQLLLEAPVPYSALGRAIQRALPVPEGVRVSRVSVFASGEGIAAAVQLRGSIEGTVYLEGTPHCTVKAFTVSLPDLRWTAPSRAALTRELGAGWVASSQHAVRRGAVVPLPEPSQVALSALARPVDRGALRVHVPVMRIRQVRITPAGLRVEVVAAGTVAMEEGSRRSTGIK